MSHINCLCGNIIHSGIIPCPDAFDVISDLIVEKIADELLHAYREVKNEAEFSKRLFAALSHLKTPGIMRAYQCPHCDRFVVYARASDWIPIFWFQFETKEFPTKINSLREAVEKMQHGEFSVGWQRDLDANTD